MKAARAFLGTTVLNEVLGTADPSEKPSRGWMSTANIWGERKSRLFDKREDAPVSGQNILPSLPARRT
jgi:hypothetical protein